VRKIVVDPYLSLKDNVSCTVVLIISDSAYCVKCTRWKPVLYKYIYALLTYRWKVVYTTRLVIKWPFLKHIVDQVPTEACYPQQASASDWDNRKILCWESVNVGWSYRQPLKWNQMYTCCIPVVFTGNICTKLYALCTVYGEMYTNTTMSTHTTCTRRYTVYRV